jgi:hypothetical protein
VQRAVQNRSVTLSQTFYEGGDPATPTGTPTYAVVNDQGDSVASGNMAGSGVGPYTVTLTPAHTAELDTLTVTMTATIGGQAQTYVETVEVAGDVFFTIAELRRTSKTFQGASGEANYPDDELVAMRTTVEQAFEDACGLAFVPRYSRQTVSGDGSTLRLQPLTRRVRWATAAGTAVPLASLEALTFSAGYAFGYSWTRGSGNISIGFEHGMDRPPERVRRAALLLAKVWLVSGPVDDRTNTFTSTEGGTFSLVTPGRGGSVFGVPEADAVVQQYRLPALV